MFGFIGHIQIKILVYGNPACKYVRKSISFGGKLP